jgi:hypothetical protein
MRKFDHNGLLLANYQGKLFEKSFDLDCSTPVFMRRFLHSNLLKTLDENESGLLALDVIEGIEMINEQFGESKYGKTKYPKEVLYWIGYMYRYISYTREESTRFIMKNFDYELMNNVYYAFHTQDPEWCVRSLLEIKKIDEDFLDKNKRLKKTIRAYYGTI